MLAVVDEAPARRARRYREACRRRRRASGLLVEPRRTSTARGRPAPRDLEPPGPGGSNRGAAGPGKRWASMRATARPGPVKAVRPGSSSRGSTMKSRTRAWQHQLRHLSFCAAARSAPGDEELRVRAAGGDPSPTAAQAHRPSKAIRAWGGGLAPLRRTVSGWSRHDDGRWVSSEGRWAPGAGRRMPGRRPARSWASSEAVAEIGVRSVPGIDLGGPRAFARAHHESLSAAPGRTPPLAAHSAESISAFDDEAAGGHALDLAGEVVGVERGQAQPPR